MQIKIVTNLDEVFLSNWFDLYLKGESSFFDNPYWIIKQKKANDSYHIVSVWNNSKLISVLPLIITKVNILMNEVNTLTHCNGKLSDYKGVLFDRDVCKSKLAKIISKEIYSFKSWDYIDYRDIDSKNPLLNSIFFSVDSYKNVFHSKVIDEVIVKTPISEFKLPKKMKWEINNNKKKLEQIGELKVKHTKNIDKSKIIELLKLRGSVYQDNNDLIDADDINDFVNIIDCEHLKNEIMYSEMLLNDDVISQHIGFIHNSEFYYYMPIFDRKYSDFSPGKLLLCELVKYCKENDIAHFNFLRGGERYKWNWAELTNFNYSFFAASKKGKLYPKILCVAHKIKDLIRTIKK